MLLALDPSVRSPGAALFLRDKLVQVGRVRVRGDYATLQNGARWLAVAHAVKDWCGEYLDHVGTIAFERPQIYRAAKSKGDPNDLIGLAGVAMALVGLLDAPNHVKLAVKDYTPHEWIGNIPKTTTGSAKTSPRAERILSRLTPAELELVPDQHDAIDAVGIGLFALGRLTPKRVYSNGR